MRIVVDIRLFLGRNSDPIQMSGKNGITQLRGWPPSGTNDRSPGLIFRAGHLIHNIPTNSMDADPLVLRFERWAVTRLSQGFSLEDAAYDLATSKRTLGRHIRKALGKSPLEYFQDVRVAWAVDALSNGNIDIDEIARQVGYANGATLCNLLRRHLNRTVRDIRYNV